jgi:hypothetical protein
LCAGLEVPESGDDLEAVVDGVAAASALSEDLPVFEPGDRMFDAGADAPVRLTTDTDHPRTRSKVNIAAMTLDSGRLVVSC